MPIVDAYSSHVNALPRTECSAFDVQRLFIQSFRGSLGNNYIRPVL